MPTYEDERSAISRRPQTKVTLTLDYCSRTFGTSPCLATGDKCYNTWSTCTYTSAYDNVNKEYKFSYIDKPLIGHGIRPYLVDYKELPTKIDPTRGIAVNPKLTLTFVDDENDTDIGIDPYVASRSSVQGSFFKKLIARNKYYIGRTVEVEKGFVNVDEANYQTRFKGIIEKVIGPTKGEFKIILKDYLKKADRVEIPAATQGKVADDPLAQGAVTINLDDASDYTTSGYIVIEDEIIKYTGKTGNQLTGCSRGQQSTTDVQHSLDTVVQQVAAWEAQNPWDIIDDIYENYVGIAAADIDVTGAEAERDMWLSGISFTSFITSPTKASELVKEICDQCYSSVWWDQEAQKVKFKVTAPPIPGASVKSLNDTSGLVSKSTDIDHNEETRLSAVVVYYNKNVLGDDKKRSSYLGRYILYDSDKEGTNEYGTRVVKTVWSRWITQEAVARALAGRTLSRFKTPPDIYSFGVELKDDDLKVGDLAQITSKDFQDVTGAEVEKTFQILEKRPRGSNRLNYLGMDTRLTGRHGFIAPNGTSDYLVVEGEVVWAFIC